MSDCADSIRENGCSSKPYYIKSKSDVTVSLWRILRRTKSLKKENGKAKQEKQSKYSRQDLFSNYEIEIINYGWVVSYSQG